ncbi:MAG: S-layer homology domain-containing protein [Oscillospiraceae bacterium]|nr:S-layer homology domain-containing protein [Oscillospiraceae bacterium]
MNRWISFLLAALLSVSLLSPVYALRGPEDQGPDSWAAIERIERQAGAEADLQSLAAREAAYAGSVDRMIRAVEAAPDYVDGSLIRHGDFFFWETADGRVNGYSPSLRAEISLCSGSDPADEAAADLRQTELYLRSGADPVAGTAFAQAEPNIPDTRDVGVMVPYSGSYYFCVDKAIAEGQALARSTGGALHVCMAENSNVDTLAQLLQTCGIVLINSHGRTDYEVGEDHSSKANSSYICLPTDAGFTAQDRQRVTGPYGSYYHAFYAGASEDFDEEYYCVDGTCIANHMQGSAPHSMVWLGLCLGMATEGLEAPLREKGVEAMIGFSERVISTTDQDYRLYFGKALLEDCTAGEAAAYMKQKVGCPDPIDVGHEPAWPIAVSSQDPYPGRDHLTEGQEVLSTWKLHPAYPIAVTVEPAGTADVKVVRTTVKITPHRGYDFSDWEITEGEASAVRTNDTLSFDLSGPAAVTLRMTARTPARVQFSAGPGQTAAAIDEFIGDTVLLPEPEGSLEADAFLYHFLGWSTEEMSEDSPDAPALLASGYKLKLTQADTTLYAVYGYYAAEDGVSRGQFRRVSEAPSNWAGTYVLTYQSVKALRASSRVTGHNIISTSASADLAKSGCFVDGDWLNEVPEELVYEFLPDETGTGLLKMKTSENYLAVPSSNVLLSTVTDPGTKGALWRMCWSDGTVMITNARFTSRILQFSSTSSGFCTLTSLRGPLTLYAGVPGEHLYTTKPVMKQPESGLPCSGGDDCPGRIFSDMPAKDHWSHDPIDWAVVNGITSGTSDTTFSPNMTCTRAQIVTFLWRAAGSPEPTTTNHPFADVNPDKYYFKPVLWAAETGITSGASDSTFSPNESCTRAQVVSFLWRFAGCPEPTAATNPFADVPSGKYFTKAVLWAAENGITAGTDNSTFSPDLACTRAQIVTFLYRSLKEML